MTFETFDQSDEETRPDRKNTYLPTYLPTNLPFYLKGTARNQGLLLLTNKEQPKRPVTFEIFDQSDEET